MIYFFQFCPGHDLFGFSVFSISKAAPLTSRLLRPLGDGLFKKYKIKKKLAKLFLIIFDSLNLQISKSSLCQIRLRALIINLLQLVRQNYLKFFSKSHLRCLSFVKERFQYLKLICLWFSTAQILLQELVRTTFVQ